MAEYQVYFEGNPQPVRVPGGALLSEAARLAGVEIGQPCGGQGRCGRCAVKVTAGNVRRRSALRLSAADQAEGFALACQTVIEGDCQITVPPQTQLERLLASDRTAAEVEVPAGYDFSRSQSVRRIALSLTPPDIHDQNDDWSRLRMLLRQQTGISQLEIPLPLLRKLNRVARSADWQVTVVLDEGWEPGAAARLIDLLPGSVAGSDPLWGAVVDIGTTTVTVWIVDLVSGKTVAQVSEYNRQIRRGEDVVSRIIYAAKPGGAEELRQLVLESLNTLLVSACQRVAAAKPLEPAEIVKVVVAGNSTMIHLLLGLPAESIRLMPFVTAANQIPAYTAQEIGLNVHPQAIVDCLPGVASYVGADITAGVLASGTSETEQATLFLDVGTNGEIVLGSREWLVTCACSAGPAFEGAGMAYGMRATRGAIEEVWIREDTYEPSYRVIGGIKPLGLCGSGLISLLGEMFQTGVVDKAGHLNTALSSARMRRGEHGPEYVIAWAADSGGGEDIVITNVDIDNLLRAKAAIYAGFTVLADQVGFPLDMVEQVLIGGSFGKYINVEKAIEIGLLPDMPWEKFQFLGNTAIRGAYLALLEKRSRQKVNEIAAKMTYIELSADNSFYEAFMSASFLPHTDLERFPSVAAAVASKHP